MADTQVKDETYLPRHAIKGDERVHCVSDPTGTPADRRVDLLALTNVFRRPNTTFAAYWVTGHAGTAIERIGPSSTTYGTSFGGNTYSTSSERLRRKRINRQTGTTAGSAAGERGTTNTLARGDASGRGGFRAILRFALNTLPASYRLFVGLSATSTLTNADPSTLVNSVGLSKDTADAAWQIMSNDGTGTASKVALDTTSFPISDTTSVIELELYCAPGNGSNIEYTVRRITGIDANGDDTYAAATSGTLSADLPATATLMQWHVWLNNDVNAANGVIEIMRVYSESYGD